MRLTVKAMESAKPTLGRDTYLRDGDGLEIRILPSGKRIWQFRYTFQGKRKVLAAGEYPHQTLKEARDQAHEWRRILNRGQDPAPAKRQAEAEAEQVEGKTEGKDTLVHLMLAYSDWKAAQGKTSFANDVRRSISSYITPETSIAQRKASQCTPSDIAALIRPIHQRGKERSAGKLRSFLAAAFQAAMQAPYSPTIPQELAGFAVTHNPVAAIPAIHGKAGERFLDSGELGRYYLALKNQQSKGLAYKCLLLSLLSGGQRPSQVARVSRDDFDARDGILRIFDLKGRRAQPRQHHIPLGLAAVSWIETWFHEKTGIWFSADGKEPLEATVLSRQCTRLVHEMDWTPFSLRDVRRGVETEMARMGFSKDLRAHLLSHGLSGIQERHYDRYDRLQEKREAIGKWEDHLESLASRST
ncbi:tyrosine-type recombinase/integrase [Acidithiobacillus sp. IBUN Pt1247-S3]|uniref:tyrosine-type recombinase/integrase n=1 Tax=Acidithiobacillus sp. IBUN Pt1247-S3 TaxID=3166642 RepID=UPI0034E5F7C0